MPIRDPADPNRPAAIQYIAQAQATIDAIIEASAKPFLGAPLLTTDDAEMAAKRAALFHNKDCPPPPDDRFQQPSPSEEDTPVFAALKHDAANIAIAAELYKRINGRYPASLADVPTTLLPSIPMDMFDGKPLRYLIKNGKPLIYSVSNDFNDNGGRPREDPDGNDSASRWRTDASEFSGDWILFPPIDPTKSAA